MEHINSNVNSRMIRHGLNTMFHMTFVDLIARADNYAHWGARLRISLLLRQQRRVPTRRCWRRLVSCIIAAVRIKLICGQDVLEGNESEDPLTTPGNH
jgi:hypothetical protein